MKGFIELSHKERTPDRSLSFRFVSQWDVAMKNIFAMALFPDNLLQIFHSNPIDNLKGK
jgi:hypothetical protein